MAPFFLFFIICGGISEFYNFIHPSAAQIYKFGKFCALELPYGSLRGNAELGRDGKRYCSFLGIPYAKTPTRFEEAEEGDDLVGFMDATKPGSKCPQYIPPDFGPESQQVIGNEDCLFLNVFFPADDQCQNQTVDGRSSLKPVIIHLHAGGFDVGSSTDFDPKYFMSECTVFVSLNYRLGALGFLSTEDEVIPGNLGLKDTIVALKWVRKNIEDFGGDPNTVSLIGYSAGSTMANHLILSAASKGLVHRVIAMSGSTLSKVVLQGNSLQTARTLATRLNCTRKNMTAPTNDQSQSQSQHQHQHQLSSSDIKQCLVAAKMEDILKSQTIYKWATYPITTYGPAVESWRPGPGHPPTNTINNPLYKLLTGDFDRVPILMGFTENEGGLLNAMPTLMNPSAVFDMNTKWNQVAPIKLYYDEAWVPESIKNHFSSEIRRYYFGRRNISMDTFQNLVDLASDRFFVQGIFDSVELYSRYTKVYPYVLSYKGKDSFLEFLGFPNKTASHGDDLLFLFKTPFFPEMTEDDAHTEFSKKYIKLLVSFAKTGIPSATWPEKNIIKPYKNDMVNPYNWYKIDTKITEVPNYLQERREFWRNLGIRRYDYPLVHY